MALVPCSRGKGKEKSHLVIFHTDEMDDEDMSVTGVNICIPLDNISSRATQFETPASDIFTLEVLLNETFNGTNGFFCATRQPTFYMFGGIDPPLSCPNDADYQDDYVTNEAFSLDLSNLAFKQIGTIEKCEKMECAMSSPLLAQVNDFIFALGNGKTRENERIRLAFQKYDIKNDEWTLLDLFDIRRCDCNGWIRRNPGYLPHVVIGSKLHISVGNSSFTFDTKNHEWDNCKLFETFWSKQKKNRLSPTNFYGGEVWYGAAAKKKKEKTFHSPPNFLAKRIWDAATKKKRMRKFDGGPPFGFYGRGIIWDKNVLLGVHYAPECIVVAFLLDDKGRVVRSQPITLNDLFTHTDNLLGGATLVDLGRDGYFGLVHPVPDRKVIDIECANLELVIFWVEKIVGADDDRFLDWEVVSEEIVATNQSDCIGRFYSAFSV